jgi:hypothetical protein
MMANTTLYVGPIAAALGGADLSALVGPVLAGALYALLWRTTDPYRDASRRPGAVGLTTAEPTTADDLTTETTDAAASGRTLNLEVPA